MTTLHFDVIGGASGDMILGALLELGVNPVVLRGALDSLAVEGIHLHVEPANDRGIHGTRVTVHAHEAPGDHHHAHDHEHNEKHAHDYDVPHRNLNDIQSIITASRLPEPVKQASLAVFRKIGEAEAKIHGTTIDNIHFHEVGALDSIADILGCCLGLHLLDVADVSVSALPMGHGTIECAHGTYPNPAPATVELSKGMTTLSVDEPFELVTPTGAALLSTWKTREAPVAGSRIIKAGYSIGHRRLDHRPNVLRAILFEAADATPDTRHSTLLRQGFAGQAPDTVLVLECNLDDTTPEIIGALTERLLAEGALDVFTTPIQMKKQRPGTMLTVLCKADDRDAMLHLLFTESTTFGVRETHMQRTILERRIETVSTPYGEVRVKVGRWKGGDVTRSPEMDDCIARAKEHGVAARTVYLAAQKA